MAASELILRGRQICVPDWRLEDLQDFVYWNQPGHRWQETDGPYYPRDTPEGLAERVSRLGARIESPEKPTPRITALISETGESRLIGQVSRYWESQPCRSMYLGVTIFDDTYRGRGFGTEALMLWTDYLFRTMDDIVRLGLRKRTSALVRAEVLVVC